MINITDSAIVKKIKGTGRTFTLSIKVGTNTFTNVKSLRRSSIFASNQKLSVGEAVSAFIEAEINDCRESLQNYEVEPILSIDGYNIPLGIFKVQAPSQADGSGTQKITAYDRMSETSKYTYNATGLTSAISTFRAICTACGYTADTSGLTDVSINDRLLDGLDCRKALGYVAGVFGKNCVVTTDGKFKMLGYSKVAESTCKISINSLDTLEFPSKVSTIDYFNAVVDEATTYKSGTGTNGVNVVNPLFKSTSQTYSILSQLQTNVGSNGYYPAKFKQLNGDPRIEVGDVIKVEHRDILTGEVIADYVPVMSNVLDYDGGVTVSIEAYATESEFSMSLSDKMNITNSSNNNKFEDLEGSIDDVNGRVDGFEEDIQGANTKADFAVIQSAAVEELNKVIGNSLGLYQTKIKGIGGDEKYYFHNKSTLESSTYIISMTDQGFAFANSWNNGNPIWTYGINPAGNSIMNYLVVNKISADLIEAGVIRSLDGAPVNTEFSLNTGLFSLESNSQKELFGFGANRYNHLLLQYNYSDGQKNNIKLGYYYGGQFYKDSRYSEIIPASTKYYYGDMPSGNFYQYSSNRYTVMSDLTDVVKTYKGFILHSCGRTVGYVANDPLVGVASDFNANMELLLGGNLGIVEDIGETPEARTPILKFYDFENESVNGSDHYTAIRKQSIVTKHLGAETFCFYLNGKLVDLDTVLTDLVTSVNSNRDKIQSSEIIIQDLSNDLEDVKATLSVLPDYKSRIESLEKAVTQLNELLGVKVLSVNVIANPTEGGSVSGSGSYTLSDGEVLIQATANEDYFISSVRLVYASDGQTATGYISDQTNYSEVWTVLPERLGDTLNVFVNFEKKQPPKKLVVNTTVNSSVMGSASGDGEYYEGDTWTLTATANSGYIIKALEMYDHEDGITTTTTREQMLQLGGVLNSTYTHFSFTQEVSDLNVGLTLTYKFIFEDDPSGGGSGGSDIGSNEVRIITSVGGGSGQAGFCYASGEIIEGTTEMLLPLNNTNIYIYAMSAEQVVSSFEIYVNGEYIASQTSDTMGDELITESLYMAQPLLADFGGKTVEVKFYFAQK